MVGLGGVDAAKGALEKLPSIISFPVAVRVLAPGAWATALLYPLTPLVEKPLPTVESSSYLVIALWAAAVFAATLALGALVSIVLGGEIYKLYEGRALWPQALLRKATGWQASRVATLLATADSATAGNDVVAYDEAWAKLRSYPLRRDGRPYAFRPTLLGNILVEYEVYPETRYGMDSVFYWPRFWLALDKEKKQDIDAGWSIADGLLALSAVSATGGIVWLLVALLSHVQPAVASMGGAWTLAGKYAIRLPFGTSLTSALAGAALLALGYIWYRLSLPFHRQNGEVFKSVFDLYRDKVAPLTRLGPQESETWELAWLYLQYLWVRCARCGETYRANLESCDRCFFLKSQTFELLRRNADKPSP